jgi:predicted DNA-binding protein with PD1-like motif
MHTYTQDHDCNVFGGHVVEGCIVRTTAEIVIGVGEGMALRRALDDRSGYEELYIVET